jgi:hypothetical protein
VLHGSQAIGADDEQSRDHGWGAEFDLMLTEADFERYGAELKSKLECHVREHWIGVQLPDGARNWHVCRKPGFIDARIGMYSIDQRLRDMSHAPEPPRDLQAWLKLAKPRQENSIHWNWNGLYYLKHAPTLDDPLGEWSRRKEAFSQYPDVLRTKLVAERLRDFWHYGAYNYLCRVARRGDAVTSGIAVGRFAEATMELWFLFNRDYAPYWKWLHHAFLKQPQHEQLEPALQRLMRSADESVRETAVIEICAVICKRLVAEGFMQEGDQNKGLNTVVDKLHASIAKEVGE